jgi:hypothetical protein
MVRYPDRFFKILVIKETKRIEQVVTNTTTVQIATA